MDYSVFLISLLIVLLIIIIYNNIEKYNPYRNDYGNNYYGRYNSRKMKKEMRGINRDVIVRLYYNSKDRKSIEYMSIWQEIKNIPNLAELTFIEIDVNDEPELINMKTPLITKVQSGIMTQYTGLMEYNSILEWILKY